MIEAAVEHGLSTTDVAADPAGGFSEAEATLRLAADGPNELSVRTESHVLATVWAQVTDTVIVVLLAAAILTPASSDAAERAPRSTDQRLLDRGQLRQIAVLGSALTVASMLAAGSFGWQHRPAQSTLFLALTFGQLAISLAGRPLGHRLRNNRMLLWSVAVNVVLVLAAAAAAVLAWLLARAAPPWPAA
ncbi:MAG: Cation transporting ATPase, C-terminus [Pseudonocardiales bacterium]|jgi:magnesium-transporting ATPase (P-type)|nr:Cation transporting ATPase, C-terminus [Pseudonocardiales bacterium]